LAEFFRSHCTSRRRRKPCLDSKSTDLAYLFEKGGDWRRPGVGSLASGRQLLRVGQSSAHRLLSRGLANLLPLWADYPVFVGIVLAAP
jgi:hypothetical protein